MATTIQRFHTPQPHPNDLTGRKAAALNEQTKEHEAARERLIRVAIQPESRLWE
jgi:hypothetical protein